MYYNIKENFCPSARLSGLERSKGWATTTRSSVAAMVVSWLGNRQYEDKPNPVLIHWSSLFEEQLGLVAGVGWLRSSALSCDLRAASG